MMASPTSQPGHPDGPCEHWCAKVQILGSPQKNWSLGFEPRQIEDFLRQHMEHVVFDDSVVEGGETNLRFRYRFPANWTETEASGTLRLAPAAGASFDALSYGMVHDLLEDLARGPKGNSSMIVVFSEFRVLHYTPGMSREDGIRWLCEAVDAELGKLFFPTEWGHERLS